MHSIQVLARFHGDSFRFAASLRSLPQAIVRWHRRHRERVSLAELDNRMLADIGMSPGDRETECAKSFWQS